MTEFEETVNSGTLDDLQLIRMARTVAYRQARTALVQESQRSLHYDAGSEGFRIIAKILTEFAGQVRREGATPVVVVLPRERDVMQNRSGFKLHLPLLWHLSAADIPTIDVTDRLTRETNGRGSEPPWDVPGILWTEALLDHSGSESCAVPAAGF